MVLGERGVASGGVIVDLFAGPGGWDIAARDLGLAGEQKDAG